LLITQSSCFRISLTITDERNCRGPKLPPLSPTTSLEPDRRRRRSRRESRGGPEKRSKNSARFTGGPCSNSILRRGGTRCTMPRISLRIFFVRTFPPRNSCNGWTRKRGRFRFLVFASLKHLLRDARRSAERDQNAAAAGSLPASRIGWRRRSWPVELRIAAGAPEKKQLFDHDWARSRRPQGV